MQPIRELDEDPPPGALPLRAPKWRSTIGLKVLMAATGIVLVAFLVFHLLGNLLVYRGREALNEYSAFLVREPALLWAARAVLLVSVVIHIGAAALLWSRDRRARPVTYRRFAPRSARVPSRTMRLTGGALAAFIVFHILHLTTGTLAPVPFEKHVVYHNVVAGFAIPWVVAVYLGAMAVVGMHVWHGAWASLRSLGMSRPSPRPKSRPLQMSTNRKAARS